MARPTHKVAQDPFTSWLARYRLEEIQRALQLSKLARPAWSGELTRAELEWTEGRYIQAAGVADKMTVEIRKESDGVLQLYTIGRPTAAVGDPDVDIQVGEHTTRVCENEVFGALEAADLVFHYFQHDEAPAGYVFRARGFAEPV